MRFNSSHKILNRHLAPSCRLPSKVVIGKTTDCLSNLEVDAEGGIRLARTTLFRLRHGTLVSRGLTSVQPTTHGP